MCVCAGGLPWYKGGPLTINSQGGRPGLQTLALFVHSLSGNNHVLFVINIVLYVKMLTFNKSNEYLSFRAMTLQGRHSLFYLLVWWQVQKGRTGRKTGGQRNL